MERLQVRISHTHTNSTRERWRGCRFEFRTHHTSSRRKRWRGCRFESRTHTQIPHARDGEVAGSNLSHTHTNSTRQRWRGCRFEYLSHTRKFHTQEMERLQVRISLTRTESTRKSWRGSNRTLLFLGEKKDAEFNSEIWGKGVCDIWEKWGWREKK